MSTYVNIKCVLTDSCNYNNNNERIDYIPYKLKEWVDIDRCVNLLCHRYSFAADGFRKKV